MEESSSVTPEQLDEIIVSLRKEIQEKGLENVIANAEDVEDVPTEHDLGDNTEVNIKEDSNEEIQMGKLEEGDLSGIIPKSDMEKYEESSIIERLRKIRKRYTSSFTMHALDHIINGTRFEKVFWTVKLLTVLCVAIWMSRELFTSYFHHHADTKVRFEPKTKIKLPMVYICGMHAEELLISPIDCSSTKAKSYDAKICEELSKKCPDFCKEEPSSENCTETLVNKFGVNCDEAFLGQCISLNAPRGEKVHYQTLTEPGLKYQQLIDEKYLPLWVYVAAPGPVELMPTPGMKMKWTKINRLGNYHFTVEETKIKRLPKPYNKPKWCIEQETYRAYQYNIFKGNYTMDKCLASCWTKGQLEKCNTTFQIIRHQVRDQKKLRKMLKPNTKEALDQCLFKERKKEIDRFVRECSTKCPTPCEEENFKVTARFEPNDDDIEHDLAFFFYYQEMKETLIEQRQSYHFSTLFANFGGTLGLMTGMSALSIIEMGIWFILFLIDRCSRCKKVIRL